MDLEELLTALRSQTEIKGQDLAEAKDLLVQKSQYISNLENQLKDYKSLLEGFQGENKTQPGSLEEKLNATITELKDRAFKDSNSYEMQLMVKDNIIKDLRSRLHEEIRENPRNTYDNEFYGTVPQGTNADTLSYGNGQGRISSIQKGEESAMRTRMASQLEQITELQTQLEAKTASVTALTQKLASLETDIVSLQTQLSAQSTERKHHQETLQEKDQIISTLESKLKEANSNLTQLTAITSIQAKKEPIATLKVKKEKNEVVSSSVRQFRESSPVRKESGEEMEENKDKLIKSLQSELRLLKSRFVDLPLPTVHKVPIALVEKEFVEDTHSQATSLKLRNLLEESIKREEEAVREVQKKITEINRIREELAKLKARETGEGEGKGAKKRVLKEARLLLKKSGFVSGVMYRKEKKRLAFLAWRYFAMLQKAQRKIGYLIKASKKESENEGKKVMITQKLEVLDGTYNVWVFIRQSIVSWIYQIFLRSNDHIYQKKSQSYIIFKANLDRIGGSKLNRAGDDFSNISQADLIGFKILMSTYSRLKNLVVDDGPQLDWDRIHYQDQLKEQENQKGNLASNFDLFEPEKLARITPLKDEDSFETKEKLNFWLEQTLCSCIRRKRFDIPEHHPKSAMNSEILHLFRLLAIKFRVEHPYRGNKLPIQKDLALALDSKICNSVMKFFDGRGGELKGQRLWDAEEIDMKHRETYSEIDQKKYCRSSLDSKSSNKSSKRSTSSKKSSKGKKSSTKVWRPSSLKPIREEY